MSFRVGTGFDVHKLVPNRLLKIGGVTIPHNLGALGYSDADVLIHAIADAILGAAVMGDIGEHFPGSDPSNKDLSGIVLLSRIIIMIEEKGLSVSNIDSTVILQKPKLKPYVDQMRSIIAVICNIPTQKVSVKATTTDFLGTIGREEGIAAMAVVLLVDKNEGVIN